MSDGYLTPEQALENAPSDLEERDVEGVFGGKVRVRALTAHQAARVHQGNVKIIKGNPEVNVGAVQLAKFELGVIAPKFTHEQVVKLHRTSGASFKRVVEVIDEISGMSEDEEAAAEAEFPDASGGSAD